VTGFTGGLLGVLVLACVPALSAQPSEATGCPSFDGLKQRTNAKVTHWSRRELEATRPGTSRAHVVRPAIVPPKWRNLGGVRATPLAISGWRYRIDPFRNVSIR